MTSAGLKLDLSVDNLFSQIKDLQERIAELERNALTGANIQADLAALGSVSSLNLGIGDLAVPGVVFAPNLAFADLASIYLGLPALKGFWPMSATGGYNVATINDLSGNALHLTNSGGSLAWINNDQDPNTKVTMIALNGSSNYLYCTDAASLRIDGVETNIISYNRGLTCGAWVRASAIGTTSKTIIAQWDAGTNQKAFRLHIGTSSQFVGILSDDGSTNTDTLAAAPTVDLGRWTFACLQWNNNTDTLRIWHDDTPAEQTSTTADMHNSTANFTIGAALNTATPEAFFSGNIAMAFLCGANIHSNTIQRIYNQTRPYFRPADFNEA